MYCRVFCSKHNFAAFFTVNDYNTLLYAHSIKASQHQRHFHYPIATAHPTVYIIHTVPALCNYTKCLLLCDNIRSLPHLPLLARKPYPCPSHWAQRVFMLTMFSCPGEQKRGHSTKGKTIHWHCNMAYSRSIPVSI